MKNPLTISVLAAISWLFFALVVTVSAIRSGPTFDSSIMSLLPKSDQQPVVQMAVEQMSDRFSKRLILLLSADNEGKARAATSQLAGDLATLLDISKIDWHIDDKQIERIQQESYPYRFSILDKASRELLLAGKQKQIQDRALLRLYNPLSMGQTSLIDDPFGLFTEMSLTRKNELNIQASNSLLKVTGTEVPTYMIMLTLAGDPFSPAVQEKVLGEITAHSMSLKQAGITLRMSGMLLHAEAGARQASHEISTIGIGSLLGIIVMILWVFRQFRPVVLMLFPVVVGCLTAAAVTMLVFGRVHLITFAFGAGLVGVSIDYALHFLCERHASSSGSVLRKILPGLLLGLFSSVTAYAAQAFTPFPGLQQMAVFSVVGLVASWLTVVLWFPLLTNNDAQRTLTAVNKLDIVRHYFPRVEGSPILIVLLLIMVGISVTLIIGSKSLDDIRLLQTSPESLLMQEKEVQKILGGSSSSQFLLIDEDSLEECLQKEEQIIPLLDSLKEQGLLLGYQAVSQQLPSYQRQTENIVLIKQLYTQHLNSFYDKLHIANEKLLEASSTLEQATMFQLSPELWLKQQESEMWQDLIVTYDGEAAATIIRFTGIISDDAKQKLMGLANKNRGVTYIDQVQNISDLMSNYRNVFTSWIVMAYFCVLLVLVFRYKTQVWRVILPPLLASLFTLALLVHLEQGLNLFHLMALILVLGIGLDMGIFLAETGESSHTWLAVSLSTYTSLLAFGLLALSDTPVLHHFGLTVLIGLVAVLLLALIMRKNNTIGVVQI